MFNHKMINGFNVFQDVVLKPAKTLKLSLGEKSDKELFNRNGLP